MLRKLKDTLTSRSSNPCGKINVAMLKLLDQDLHPLFLKDFDTAVLLSSNDYANIQIMTSFPPKIIEPDAQMAVQLASTVLPLFQIISHSKNLGESNHLKV